MKDLIERLEKGTGPDRELGNQIPVALGYIWNGRLSSGNPRGQWEHPDGRTLPDSDFTGSIDAALSLVPEGWAAVIYVENNGSGDVRIGRHQGDEDYMGFGKTPAIALCIAALKARTAIEAERDLTKMEST
jgi:hypothetical protein